MAIVPMHKIFIAGMKSERKAMMELLLRAGVVQTEEFSPEETAEYASFVAPANILNDIDRTEDELFRVKTAISLLAPYDKRKKGLFAPKKTVSSEEYAAVAESKQWQQLISVLCSYQKRREEILSEKNHLNHKIEQLKCYEKLDVPLSFTGSRRTEAVIGTIPALFELAEIRKRAEEENMAAELTEVSADEINRYVFALYLDEEAERFLALLEEYGFEKTALEAEETAAEAIRSLRKKQEALNARAKHMEADLLTMTEYLPKLEIYYDYLSAERDKIQASAALLETESTFYLRGWLPAEAGDALKEQLEKEYPRSVVEITAPQKDEETPILLRNNKFVQPFEMITELYSLPNSHEIDPNPSMSVFYMMFFGLMLSDAGYGILLTLLTGFVLLKFKPEGLLDKMMRLLCLGGIATTFWGVLFGSWFGDLFSGISFFSPVWFSPLNDPMTLLIWSFAFGAVHLFTGMAVKAYMLIKDGHLLDALFDVGLWYVFLIGLVLLLFAPSVGKVMAIGGAVGLVLTQGRGEKNLFMRFGKGILSLYDVTGYLSDVLSYSRLLALGLATGVIAQVVNTMGKLTGTSFVGIVFFLIILLVGHTFNLAINTLGAYVHASRLQYVEFFGKFYTGGGRAFEPLSRKTKYITIK